MWSWMSDDFFMFVSLWASLLIPAPAPPHLSCNRGQRGGRRQFNALNVIIFGHMSSLCECTVHGGQPCLRRVGGADPHTHISFLDACYVEQVGAPETSSQHGTHTAASSSTILCILLHAAFVIIGVYRSESDPMNWPNFGHNVSSARY